MDVDQLGVLAPDPPGVLEVADEFLFLRVDTDLGRSPGGEGQPLLGDLRELPVAIRIPTALFRLFGIGMEPIALRVEEPPDGGAAGRVAGRRHLTAQEAQAGADPLLVAHRVAGGVRLDHRRQGGQDSGIFCSIGGRPPPDRR